MRKFIFAGVLLAVITIAAAPKPANSYDFFQAWVYLIHEANAENRELRAENAELELQVVEAAKVPQLQAEIAELKGDLTEANVIVAQVNGYTNLQDDVESLKAQRDGILSSLGAISDAQSVANTQLQALRVERDALAASMSSFAAMPAMIAQVYPGRTIWADRIGCTGSMVPWITCADLNIMLAYPTVGEVQVGDPIVYKDRWNHNLETCVDWINGHYLMHRVTGIAADGNYIVTGDANNGWADPCTVPHVDVIAKALDPNENFYPENWGAEGNSDETWRDN